MKATLNARLKTLHDRSHTESEDRFLDFRTKRATTPEK
jgi:hypothetical protein